MYFYDVVAYKMDFYNDLVTYVLDYIKYYSKIFTKRKINMHYDLMYNVYLYLPNSDKYKLCQLDKESFSVYDDHYALSPEQVYHMITHDNKILGGALGLLSFIKKRCKNSNIQDLCDKLIKKGNIDIMLKQYGIRGESCTDFYDHKTPLEFYHKYLAVIAPKISHLNSACTYGNLKLVKLLLCKIEPIIQTLYLACETGNIEIVKLLLCKIDPDNEILEIACKKGHTEIVKLLLCKIDPIIQTLNLACESINAEIVKLLLYKIDPTNETLTLACKKNSIVIVKLLLETNKIFHSDKALEAACSNGSYLIVKLLLDNINMAGPDNKAFQYACKSKSTDIAKLLINHSAIYITEKSLDCACTYNLPIIVKILLGKKIKPNGNMFYFACSSGDVEVVEILLNYNSLDFIKNKEGNIRNICSDNYTNILKLLLDCKKFMSGVNIDNINVNYYCFGTQALLNAYKNKFEMHKFNNIIKNKMKELEYIA
jgi:ankyrin repeat protein